jgi:hypoxanthine phosphoribosyltransferase
LHFINLIRVIKLHDKIFDVFIDSIEIESRIKTLAKEINEFYFGKEDDLVFISVLNGSFMFASDLIKNIKGSCEISFIKVSSYQGLNSSGRVDELIGLNHSILGKHVIIVEDIVDTGITIDKIFTLLGQHNPASIKVASLLFKEEAFKGKNVPEFIGFTIPNKFVVGYGLDYNEKGRNLDAVYQLKEN